MPCEVRALDQICYLGSVYPLTAVAALAIVKLAEQPFRLSVLLDERDRLELRWSVAPGYFLYRDKSYATLNGKPLKVKTARGEIKDETRQPIDLFRRTWLAGISIGIDDLNSRDCKLAITLPLAVAVTVVALKLGRPGGSISLLTFSVMKGCRPEIGSLPSSLGWQEIRSIGRHVFELQ